MNCPSLQYLNKDLTVWYLCQWRWCVLYCGSAFAWF